MPSDRYKLRDYALLIEWSTARLYFDLDSDIPRRRKVRKECERDAESVFRLCRLAMNLQVSHGCHDLIMAVSA